MNLAPLMFGVWLGGCGRQADIYDEPDAIVLTPTGPPEAGDIPELDAGLGSDVFSACNQRPAGGCEGPSDFGCVFTSWVENTATRCHALTGCKTNGWLHVKLDGQGCVTLIGMDQPNDPMVKCLIDEFTSTRCGCTDLEAKFFFGLGNRGVVGDASRCVGPKG